MGDMRITYKILVGKPEGKKPVTRPRLTWEIIFERILGKQGGRVWTGCIWLRTQKSGGHLWTR
jgi:hypothetical protein